MVTFIWFIVFWCTFIYVTFFSTIQLKLWGVLLSVQYTCLSFHNCSFHFFCYTRCFLNQGFVGAQIPRWWSLWNEVFTHHHPFHIILTFFSISLGVQQAHCNNKQFTQSSALRFIPKNPLLKNESSLSLLSPPPMKCLFVTHRTYGLNRKLDLLMMYQEAPRRIQK